MMVGLLGLVTSFMLIMVKDNGKDILITFTAVQFISYLDDAMFTLGAVTEVFILRASSRYKNSLYASTTFPDYVLFIYFLFNSSMGLLRSFCEQYSTTDSQGKIS